MSFYSVYKTEDLKKSLNCECGRCIKFKEFFHAIPFCFTKEIDKANKFFVEGTTLIQYDYHSEFNMTGQRITSRDVK